MRKTIEEVLEISLERIINEGATVEDCLRDYSQYQKELREMLPLVISVKSLEQIKPSQAFSQNAGMRLVLKLPDKPVTFWETFRHIFSRKTNELIRRYRMSQIVITILLAISLLSGGSYAVQASGPGDWLYELDRSIEQIRLRLCADPDKGIALRLQYATERLEEAEQKMSKGKMENALAAFEAYDETIVEIAGLIEGLAGQNRVALRSMAQETLALQAGILDRIRLSWPEDAQARNAYQKALQRFNMGVDQLFGSPETTPQGASEDLLQGPGQEDAQGPGENVPQGPNEAAPQGPTEVTPQGPNEDAPHGPSEGTDQGPSEDAPKGND